MTNAATKRHARAAEQWRAAPGYPDYEVSSEGRVRRATFGVRRGRAVPGRLVRAAINHAGYHRVSLFAADGTRGHHMVHRLVATAFIGPPPSDKHQAAHRDSDRSNNHIANLRWATPKENAADRPYRDFAHGPQREQPNIHPDRPYVVQRMLYLRRLGYSYNELAALFWVPKSRVKSLARYDRQERYRAQYAPTGDEKHARDGG